MYIDMVEMKIDSISFSIRVSLQIFGINDNNLMNVTPVGVSEKIMWLHDRHNTHIHLP